MENSAGSNQVSGSVHSTSINVVLEGSPARRLLSSGYYAIVCARRREGAIGNFAPRRFLYRLKLCPSIYRIGNELSNPVPTHSNDHHGALARFSRLQIRLTEKHQCQFRVTHVNGFNGKLHDYDCRDCMKKISP